VSVASFFGFVFSAGGIILSMLAVTAWLLARPRSRGARKCLVGIAGGYTIVSTYPVPHFFARLRARPFHPLTRADVPLGRSAVVLLGSSSYTSQSWADDTLSELLGIGYYTLRGWTRPAREARSSIGFENEAWTGPYSVHANVSIPRHESRWPALRSCDTSPA
jgi:hypothetical protein